jgi:hypothetical protein
MALFNVPGRLPEDSALFIPRQQFAVNVSSADVDLTNPATTGFKCNYARRLFIGTGGTLTAQMAADSAPVARTVQAGTYVDGFWVLIKNVGTSASGIVAEV